MAEKSPTPEKDQVQYDSLNIDIFEPTDVLIDNTVRPMPDSLRKWLKLPPYDKSPPTGKPPQQSPSDKPSA
jgi:hypothetical protein